MFRKIGAILDVLTEGIIGIFIGFLIFMLTIVTFMIGMAFMVSLI